MLVESARYYSICARVMVILRLPSPPLSMRSFCFAITINLIIHLSRITCAHTPLPPCVYVCIILYRVMVVVLIHKNANLGW